MNLKQLLDGISYEVQQGTADVEISDFQYDSRNELYFVFFAEIVINGKIIIITKNKRFLFFMRICF